MPAESYPNEALPVSTGNDRKENEQMRERERETLRNNMPNRETTSGAPLFGTGHRKRFDSS